MRLNRWRRELQCLGITNVRLRRQDRNRVAPYGKKLCNWINACY
jgi:hypothetical protein